ncbi:MAG TPA: hypothetical protein VIJ00_13830 [Nakamurella sp.]
MRTRRIISTMDVELLVVPDCPGAAPAREMLRAALTHAEMPGLEVRETVIADERQAQARRFAGSPTLLIDGVDPFAEPGLPVGMSCRIYRDSAGHRSNLPSMAELVRVIHAAQTPTAARS